MMYQNVKLKEFSDLPEVYFLILSPPNLARIMRTFLSNLIIRMVCSRVITELLTTLPQADSSSHMENVSIDMGLDINSEHWCIGPQLQSMPINSQQILDKLRREPATLESMEPILMGAEIRWNPGTVACMGQSDAAPILATRPNCMDNNHVEYDDSILTKAKCPALSPGDAVHQSCLLHKGGPSLDRVQAMWMVPN
ncbi:hypothetical protein Nepgr_018804 [Nepenthes gracilis]|uniref:Uncharacterized protein n=1 Tax=Nepenthes gracilis TaxID=150966 RepID=A0AAD3XTT4_NEPGR|nr:hypothetical protein Nepgr_018804 [Nepenthes gracilis]